MQQNGEETNKMSVWRKAQDPTNLDVVQAIKECERLLLLEPEDQRHFKAVKDRILHFVTKEDGHGYCLSYGSGVHRSFVYPQSSTPSGNNDDLVQKITESIAKQFEEKFEGIYSRLNFLENKGNHNSQFSMQVVAAME